jgi:acyl-CoA thioester hydrolase
MADEKKGQEQKQPQVIVGSMPYRVAMAEVDAYGVMYYSRVFDIFERGRTELFRALGFEYKKIFSGYYIINNIIPLIIRNSFRYKKTL